MDAVLAYMTAKSLDGLLEMVDEFGGSSAQLIESTGVSRALLSDGDALIPYTLFCHLVETAVRQVGRPDFALELARRRMQTNYAKEIKVYVLAAQTLRQALEGLLIHLRTRTLGIDYSLEIDGGIACFSRMLPPREATRFPQGTILVMASLYLLLRESSGNRLQLTSVSFAFKDPGLSADLKAFFRCPVQFDAEADSLNFPARFLELDIPTQDAGLRDLAADYLRMRRLEETGDFVDLVKSLISRNLAAGRPDIEALSLRIPFRSRTIQKKLNESGTSFSELLNEVRFELAESLLLESDIPITFIAQRLCYQDISAFSKAFRKRYDLSPRQWKSQRLQVASVATQAR